MMRSTSLPRDALIQRIIARSGGAADLLDDLFHRRRRRRQPLANAPDGQRQPAIVIGLQNLVDGALLEGLHGVAS